MNSIAENKPTPVVNAISVSLEVVWQGSIGKLDARMSEISMEGCFIESRVQGRVLGDLVAFQVHLQDGPWVSLQGELISEDYPIGFALRFRNLTASDEKLLAQVVAGQKVELVDVRPANAAVERAAPLQVPGPRRNVLVADDDALTLRMVTAIVESEGYRAVAVTDGRQALRLLQKDSFSAAILDMKMPHLQGLDLILYMKADERLRRIPVGMITADRDPKVWDDSVAAGACVMLPKPFTPAQVQMMVRMLASKAA